MSAEGDIASKLSGGVEGVNLQEGTSENRDADDVVNPWNVESSSLKGVDYDKLISKCYWKLVCLVCLRNNL